MCGNRNGISCVFTTWKCVNMKQYGMVGNVDEWLKQQDSNWYGLGLKPTGAILLCPWERHFTALSLAWRSLQAILNSNYISMKLKKANKKFQVDSNILVSLEAGPGNCLPKI